MPLAQAGLYFIVFIGGLAMGSVGMILFGLALSLQTTRHP